MQRGSKWLSINTNTYNTGVNFYGLISQRVSQLLGEQVGLPQLLRGSPGAGTWTLASRKLGVNFLTN